MGSFGFMAPEQAWGLPNHIPWPNRSWATANSPPPRKKIDYSLALDPSNADYLLLRDQLLQSGLKFKEARDAFAQILRRQPLNENARENLELCESLLRSAPRRDGSPFVALTALYEALVRQKRAAEALAVAPKLSGAKDAILAVWRNRLEKAGINGKLSRNTDATLNLSIPAGAATDLTVLEGMPIRGLDINNSPELRDLRFIKGMPLDTLGINSSSIKDLSPLIGTRLRDLNIGFSAVRKLGPLAKILTLRVLTMNNTAISDLSALSELKLESLSIGSTRVTILGDLDRVPLTTLQMSHTKITDLGPVALMPLQKLDVSHTEVSDISPLQGLPLRRLQLNDCRLITDLAPLKTCRTLESPTLPPQHGDIEFLRSFPSLKNLSYISTSQSATNFWQAYDAKKGNSNRGSKNGHKGAKRKQGNQPNLCVLCVLCVLSWL